MFLTSADSTVAALVAEEAAANVLDRIEQFARKVR
jgi:hypothetical protein